MIALSFWPMERLGEALAELSHNAALTQTNGDRGPVPTPNSLSEFTVGLWLQSAASRLGVEAFRVRLEYQDLASVLRTTEPTIICVPGPEIRYIAVQHGDSEWVHLLGADFVLRRVEPTLLLRLLGGELEASHAGPLSSAFDMFGIDPACQVGVKNQLTRFLLARRGVTHAWEIRLASGRSVITQLVALGLGWRLGLLCLAHVVQHLLFLLAWWVIGRAALTGSLNRDWLLGWTLILATIIPFQLMASWSQGALSVGIGAVLRHWLLYGALQLEVDDIRLSGIGRVLACKVEVETVETMGLAGAFLTFFGLIELALGAVVLSLGAAPWLLLSCLFGWLVAEAYIAHQLWRRARGWTRVRLSMTHALVDQMLGYRTRLIQQSRRHWHDGEDVALAGYLEVSQVLDRARTRFLGSVSRGWFVVAFAGVAYATMTREDGIEAAAVTIGGIVLVGNALGRLGLGVFNLVTASIAWDQVRIFARAGDRADVSTASPAALPDTPTGTPLVEFHNVRFSHPGRGDSVIRECSLTIRQGDRVLLTGASGAGKSTLAALVSGLRVPQSGLVLLKGYDRRTLGPDTWRRHVAASPQFHENYVFAGTLLFNLLMGSHWPPASEKVREAVVVCRELGLGDLIDRMPGGVDQLVGETGWQLSHGERSRLYLARALLQGSDLVILDESFAALDPGMLERALSCTLKRARTLVVIAHT